MASQVSKWACHKIECLADFIHKVSAGTKDGGCYVAVSYTHLTLPTIYSV